MGLLKNGLISRLIGNTFPNVKFVIILAFIMIVAWSIGMAVRHYLNSFTKSLYCPLYENNLLIKGGLYFMSVSLCKANLDDAVTIHEMQVKAFMPLLEKYQDYDTNPATESLERIIARFNQPFTDYYLIKYFKDTIGGIRVVNMGNKSYRVSPIFILPEYQGKGIAQKVFMNIEQIYDDAKSWELDTILQEEGLCYLYEKLGYKKTGETKKINDTITIVFYEKSHSM